MTRQEIIEYIKDKKNIVLSSSKDNKPYSCTVYFCYDEDLNLYFLSKLHRRHSQEILENPNVSLACAIEYTTFGFPNKGVQFEGECELMEGDEALSVLQLYRARYPKANEIVPDEHVTGEGDFADDVAHRVWKVKLSRVKVFDESNSPAEKIIKF